MNLQDYLRELQKIKPLEPAEEAALWQYYKDDNDLEARRRIIEAYQPLVFKAVMNLKYPDNVMDVVQEGTVGLIEAVENYDYRRGVAFSLYALHRIRGRMLNFMQKEGSRDLVYIDKPLIMGDSETTMSDNLVDTAPPVAIQAEDNYMIGELKAAMSRLPAKEQAVLDGVYLKDQEPKELAKLLDVTPSHIYRLQKQGIRRIRGMLSKLRQHW